jgi:hypothetical protein
LIIRPDEGSWRHAVGPGCEECSDNVTHSLIRVESREKLSLLVQLVGDPAAAAEVAKGRVPSIENGS